jgi:hypothetical protein
MNVIASPIHHYVLRNTDHRADRNILFILCKLEGTYNASIFPTVVMQIRDINI